MSDLYVIINENRGDFVAVKRHYNLFTDDLRKARTFSSKALADVNCEYDERSVAVSQLLSPPDKS